MNSLIYLLVTALFYQLLAFAFCGFIVLIITALYDMPRESLMASSSTVMALALARLMLIAREPYEDD